MEFSYNYNNTMSRFAGIHPLEEMPNSNSQYLEGCPAELHFKVEKAFSEVPLMGYVESKNLLLQNLAHTADDDASLEIIIPLVSSEAAKMCSGADTIMKYFVNNSFGRLVKAETPKGERYYGGMGVVLDKDFNPLIYVTRTLGLNVRVSDEQVIIHVSPSVFTDDVSVLNKAILRKGIAYYLTHTVGTWQDEHTPLIVIDDGKKFFRSPAKPSPESDINTNVNTLLKDHISEVLGQIKFNGRYF